ncbi:hypothetical protein HK100_005418 [Physocladia obscura]|uniref:Uncharacterized protein n=1 Tax=Physocladia obscura TaxID=109957 RepID=A0AAD5X9D0_9FUNG|nr:hypothetical protein HK100_005418 [Physocladia obscura]
MAPTTSFEIHGENDLHTDENTPSRPPKRSHENMTKPKLQNELSTDTSNELDSLYRETSSSPDSEDGTNSNGSIAESIYAFLNRNTGYDMTLQSGKILEETVVAIMLHHDADNERLIDSCVLDIDDVTVMAAFSEQERQNIRKLWELKRQSSDFSELSSEYQKCDEELKAAKAVC